jgi:c-di-AMP phosphodiesterase-like protein
MEITMQKKGKRNQSFKPAGPLKSFLLWPIYIGIVLIILNISLYFINTSAGTVMSLFMIVYIMACGFMLFYLRPGIMHEMIEFSSNYSQVQRQLLYELSVPYCLMDNNGRVMWMNKAMLEKTEKRKEFKKNISTIFPEITANIFPSGLEPKEVRISYNNRDYCVEMKKITVDELTMDVNIVESNEDNSFIAMYMFDETDINMYIQKIKDERFVVSLIYIDNYEEALESIDDVRRSLFIGLIDKRVNKYFSSGAAIVRKLEKDKYLAVFRYKYLEKLVADRFSILEEIKNVKIGNEMTITLSISVGTGANDYAKNYDIAKAAMDLALGRGGDQAVVKDGEKILYYGGKSQQMEKNTRVKVRVKAHALKQILDTNDNILIMGHKLADIDSFGSAIGIYAICRKLNKNAHIVINDVTTSVKPFMNRFIDKDDYPEDMFLTKEEAVEYVDPSTAVIVVDVNKAELTECPELLERCRTIIVFDHHRQSSEPISGAVLSYVDPYASSASEMITEMIQYVDDGVKIKAFEADALYAGINIDTDGFNNKSGPRTFEAAAFLRRHGADVTRVRKMLRNNMDLYKAVAEAVSKAEVYRDCFAITVFYGEGLESPTIGGAKAANQLLDISGIKASFVITAYNDKIYISARSIDEINVQLVMEKLGGGGHMTIAGAQLKDCTAEQAVQTIKITLDNMINEGEI